MMRRIAALAMVAVLYMGADGGCDPKGDPTATAPAPAPADPKPNPRKTRDDRQPLVRIAFISTEATYHRITWAIGNKGEILDWHGSRWNTTQRAWPGAEVELTVEAVGQGRYINCIAEVDGEIVDYMHRNDAGDCKVSYVIP